MKIWTCVLFLATIGINMAAYPVFYAGPRLFYYRPWEYFREITFHDKAFPSIWDGKEDGDQTRDNFFTKQDSRVTHVTADQWGYRTSLNLLPYPAIVFFGDSQMYGSHLSDDETLPWVLAERLKVQTFNAANNTRTITGLLKEPEFKCLQLIVDTDAEWIHPHDIAGESHDTPEFFRAIAPSYSRRIDIFKLADVRRYNMSFIIVNLLRRIRNDVTGLWEPGEKDVGGGFNNEDDFKKSKVAALPNYNFVRRKNLKYVYMPISTRFSTLAPYDIMTEKDLDGTPPSGTFSVSYSSMLVSFLQKNDVPAVDFSRQFRAMQKAGVKTYNMHDSHWSPKGVVVAEQTLEKYILENGLFDRRAYRNCAGP